MHWAALADKIEAARLLIDAGADVNLPRIGGGQQTALHMAAGRGNIEVARLLIAADADVGARASGGTTPLHETTGADNVGVGKLLIDGGADIEARGTREITPLMRAAVHNAVGTIELLVTAGADIDAKLPSGRTALYFAMEGGADAVRKLIKLGADLNGAPETEPVFPSTPLAMAIARGLDEIADILREAGASE